MIHIWRPRGRRRHLSPLELSTISKAKSRVFREEDQVSCMYNDGDNDSEDDNRDEDHTQLSDRAIAARSLGSYEEFGRNIVGRNIIGRSIISIVAE